MARSHLKNRIKSVNCKLFVHPGFVTAATPPLPPAPRARELFLPPAPRPAPARPGPPRPPRPHGPRVRHPEEGPWARREGLIPAVELSLVQTIRNSVCCRMEFLRWPLFGLAPVYKCLPLPLPLPWGGLRRMPVSLSVEVRAAPVDSSLRHPEEGRRPDVRVSFPPSNYPWCKPYGIAFVDGRYAFGGRCSGLRPFTSVYPSPCPSLGEGCDGCLFRFRSKSALRRLIPPYVTLRRFR